ncbi:MAG: TonB-dependent receptor [Elusimicrobia bacterium]|nr:TonB-dependent receptor [Elusimicrobiota bacterium]
MTLLPAAAVAEWPAGPDDIVVTATRYPRALQDLPARVTVVTAADLQRLPIERVDEALAYIAGVDQYRSDGAFTPKSVVSLRGTPTTQQGRTLVLLDGVPVNKGATGDVVWNRIPIEIVDRIEVFKGPASSIYGADAIGGVINILTRRPSSKVEALAVGETEPALTVDNERGMLALRTSSGAAPGFYVRGYGFRGYGGGYNSTPLDQRTSKYTQYGNRYYHEDGTSALGGWSWKTGRAEFEYSESNDMRGEGQRIQSSEGLNRRYGLDSCRVTAEGALGDTSWRLLGYRQKELYRRLNESQTSATNYQRVDTVVDRRDYSVQGGVTQPLPLGQRLTLGGEFKSGKVNGLDNYQTTPFTTLNDRGDMDTWAVYLQDDAKPWESGPSILASLRYDAARFYNGFYSDPSNLGLSGPIPTANWDALTWRASARQGVTDSLSAYVSYSRGFRQPSIEDMVLTLVKSGKSVTQGNPNLGPERLDTYETGADYTPVTGLRLSPSLFYSRGWDFIYSIDTGRKYSSGGKLVPISQNQNVSSVDIYGAEAEATYSADPATLMLSYTFNQSRIRDYNLNPAMNGTYLATVPKHEASATVAWRFPWVNLSAAWRYKGWQFAKDQETGPVPPYSTLGFKAWQRVGAGFTLSAALENALNNRFQESTTDMAPGRTVMGRVTWDFR